MRLARGLLIVAYGFFTIAAQTLLFREFVTAFEGNDISVGVFFGSWFLWIGLGAILVRRWGRTAEALLRHIELAFLAYIPALVIQLLLIVQVRALAGLASYDLMSVQAMVIWSLVVNAPVSLVTGLLFPLACRWIEQTQSFPVSRVYVLEAVGSLLGGIAVTVLLALHLDVVRILLLIAIALATAVLGALCVGAGPRACPEGDGQPDRRGQPRGVAPTSRARHAAQIASAIFVLLPILSLAGGLDALLSQRLRLLKWTRLLPRDAYQGALQTAQAEYLYGQYQGQWVVVRDGAACESLPNEAAGQAAAIALCQKPDAKRVLVIGSGLGLCGRFLTLPQIEQVAWAHADGEYVAQIPGCVPEALRINDARFHPITDELRRHLAAAKDRFDLIVLNLPDVTNSTSNRYFTAESFAQLRAALTPSGVLSVSVAGGENVIGAELAGLGASVKLTLAKVFAHVVVVPGDETWLLASDSADLTGDPAMLRDRFAGVKGAERIFPPAGLLSVYLPDRAAQAMASYDKVGLPASLLVNRDAHPLTHLYSLLLAARQSGASVTQLVKLLAPAGWWPILAAILVFVALRVWSMTRERGEGGSSFDSSFLVFSTGWVSIAVVIVLMYLYETRFGSLYLHIGVISSLFMVGLTLGAALIGRLARLVGAGPRACPDSRDEAGQPQGVAPMALLIGLIVLHGLVLVAIAVGLARWQAGHACSRRSLSCAGCVAVGTGRWPPHNSRPRVCIPARPAAGLRPLIISARVSVASRRAC